jgi:hypothetical protein
MISGKLLFFIVKYHAHNLTAHKAKSPLKGSLRNTKILIARNTTMKLLCRR